MDPSNGRMHVETLPPSAPGARGQEVEAEHAPALAQCFDQHFPADLCCDLQNGQKGHPFCWSGDFTFEACCPAYFAEVCSLSNVACAGGILAALLAVGLAIAARLPPQVCTGKRSNGGEKGPRLVQLDCAKFWLVALVVFSHTFYDGGFVINSLQLTPLGPLINFHVRALCLISGVGAGSPTGERYMRTTVLRAGLPLVLMLTIGDPVLGWLTSAWPSYPTGPNFHWFLFCLICWRSWATLLGVLRPSVQMLIAILISAACSFVDLNIKRFAFWDMNKAAAMFPVFVFGQHLPLQRLAQGPLPRFCRVVACVSLVASLGALQASSGFRRLLESLDTQTHYDWRLPWDFCGSTEVRLAFLFCVRGLCRNAFDAARAVVFVLSCPRAPGLASDLGRHTIFPYALHIYGLRGLMLLSKWAPAAPRTAIALAMALWSLAAMVVLSARPVRAVFGWLLRPDWLEGLLCGPAPQGDGGRDKTGQSQSSASRRQPKGLE